MQGIYIFIILTIMWHLTYLGRKTKLTIIAEQNMLSPNFSIDFSNEHSLILFFLKV